MILVSGRIKDLKVGHQPFDKSEPEASLSANYSQNDCFVSRISFTTLLRMVLNFCQSLSKFNLFAFLYSRLRFRICCFNDGEIRGGSIVMIFTSLFGIHSRAVVLTALCNLTA